MFNVIAAAVFSDDQGDYPDEVTIDLTDEQRQGILTLDEIVARVRNSSNGRYLTDQGLTLRALTIELEQVR